jgi:ABC-type uncharacterized transport system involved in gliding motility auxiliary subunit
MKTRWMKFLGILGFVLFIVGVGMLTMFGSSVVREVTFGHIFLGILCLAVWFIGEGTRTLGQRGGVLSGKTVKFGSGTIVYTALFLTLLVMVNWFGARYNKRFDLTENGVFSLAQQSRDAVKNLDKPLKFVAFQAEGEKLGPANDILTLYKEANPAKVSYEVVDPRKSPHLVEKYDMKQGNLLYVELGTGDDKGVSRINELSEQGITNAISKLKGGAAKKIYVVTGHGEPSLEEEQAVGIKLLGESLKDEHLKVEGLMISTLETIPVDAAAVLLISPSKLLQEAEKQLLIKYADNGGALFLFADPRGSTQLTEIAKHFGITVRNDVVVDTVQRMFAGPALGLEPIATSYGSHPIVSGLKSGQDISVFNIASSLEVAEGDKIKDAEYADLVYTGGQSWSETNVAAIFDSQDPTVEFGPEDKKGPVTLAVTYEKEVPTQADGAPDATKKKAKVVVFGDSDWIKNGVIENSFNKDLALNAVNWLAGQETSISIRPRSMKASSADMSPTTVKTVLVSSFMLPELILLFGLFVWWKRKETGSSLV